MHAAVMEVADREAVMIVGGFSLCEGCGMDAVQQVVVEARVLYGRSPGQVVAEEIARCQERGFL
jgi:hypothetical protein